MRLRILSPRKALLGRKRSTPSKVRTWAVRESISFTTAYSPSISMMSRMRTGFSTMRMRPLMRFRKKSWAPTPIPMATAPPRKAKAVRGMCTTCRAKSTSPATKR